MATITKVYLTKQHANAVKEIVNLVKPDWYIEVTRLQDDRWQVLIQNSDKTTRRGDELAHQASEIFFQNTLQLKTAVDELMNEKLRVFKAFSNAHATLKLSGNDTRSFQDRVEAEAVILIETGEGKGITWSEIEDRVRSEVKAVQA